MRPLVKSTPIDIEMNKEFENLIQPYMHDLRNYCASLSKSTWDGDDLMQETLEKAYNDWLKKQKPIAKAFLFRIASNTRIDGYRKRKLAEVMNPDLSDFKQEENVLSDATIKVMEVMLRELTPKQRTTVMLTEAFGYTAKEISLMIDSSEGAVKAALHRARKRLRPITYDSPIFYPEEEKTLTYVTALHNGDPSTIVRLYQNEMIEPRMAGLRSLSSNPCSVVQPIAGSGLTYILVTISMKKGRTLFIPFYQVEIATLLSRLEELESDSSVAA
ncbi:RNA polymerase sigma factor [Virgibacillus necropolis]|uniref:RNA polymerase sigma factor n=1 Tax=Virgibacillus necropolis TaxID=163877 RepID=UPI00384A5D4F